MRGFQANNCRLCQKVFCCKKCRLKHEKNVHKIYPDCDICVYGNFFLENLDHNFLQHLETSHLPVHCVYCKRIFSSVEDLLQHKKCSYYQTKEHSPKTPFKASPAILISTDDNDSPILQELQRQEHLNYILATSTPMQRGEEPNLIFGKSKEVITPVDKHIRVTNKSIIKKTDSAKSEEQLSKRRVTFGETPSNNPSEKNMKGNLTSDREIVSSQVLESLDGQSVMPKSNENCTPVTGITTSQFYSAKTETGQFYSAKTEIGQFYTARSDIPSKFETDKINIKNIAEGFTPVGIPNISKFGNVKGDIYKKQDQQISGSSETKDFDTEDNIKIQNNLNEVSMELCTPAKNFNSSENCKNIIYKQSANHNFSPVTENENNHTKNSLDLCTPAKTSNSGKIVVKGDIYKDSEQENISTVGQVSKESEESDKYEENKSKDSLETKEVPITETTKYDTMWLSAVDLEHMDDASQNDENKCPSEKHELLSENSPIDAPGSSPQSDQRKVSIVMPTPILKTTNLQMKFRFPAHLSSTPILSSGGVKLKQTKDISTRVIMHQTPYKTPQGNLYELRQRKFVNDNLHRNLEPLPDVESGPSTSTELIHSENVKENCNPLICRDILQEQYGDTCSSMSSHKTETEISVSSMTESNLWSSMSKIVKSVFGGFTNMSKDSNNTSTKNISVPFKRQLSDSDTGDFLEAPRLKRFKFTDIKCRRTIRDLPVLEMPSNLSAPRAPLASIEIVKSVSTLYGRQAIKIQCDKATQTDDYLMYGWHPYF